MVLIAVGAVIGGTFVSAGTALVTYAAGTTLIPNIPRAAHVALVAGTVTLVSNISLITRAVTLVPNIPLVAGAIVAVGGSKVVAA
jgi:hypothetical protein